jgi:hypothetical protein
MTEQDARYEFIEYANEAGSSRRLEIIQRVAEDHGMTTWEQGRGIMVRNEGGEELFMSRDSDLNDLYSWLGY